MTTQDPIADLLTHIRNGQAAFKDKIEITSSKIKVAIVDALKREGYVSDYEETNLENNSKSLAVNLKYYDGKPVISKIKRISKTSLRIYKKASELPKVLGGLGISIISTSKGILTDREARSANLGGELLCEVE